MLLDMSKMWKYLRYSGIIILCMSFSGCALFLGKYAVIGIGERNIEYYEDGSIKKMETKGNSPIPPLVRIGDNE